MKLKSGILFFPLLFLLLAVCGQGKIKVYAYSQKVVPGVPQRTVTLNTNEEIKQPVKTKTDYWFYITLPKTTSIQPTEAWIEGKGYTIEVTELENNSVKTPDQKILVPASDKKILKLTPTGAADESKKISSKLKKCIRKNALVVVYTYRNRDHHKGVKHISELESLHMQ